jgi:hypothetical protein
MADVGHPRVATEEQKAARKDGFVFEEKLARAIKLLDSVEVVGERELVKQVPKCFGVDLRVTHALGSINIQCKWAKSTGTQQQFSQFYTGSELINKKLGAASMMWVSRLPLTESVAEKFDEIKFTQVWGGPTQTEVVYLTVTHIASAFGQPTPSFDQVKELCDDFVTVQLADPPAEQPAPPVQPPAQNRPRDVIKEYLTKTVDSKKADGRSGKITIPVAEMLDDFMNGYVTDLDKTFVTKCVFNRLLLSVGIEKIQNRVDGIRNYYYHIDLENLPRKLEN